MATHPTHKIFPFCHPDYTLEWHEQEGRITAERIFPNGMRDQEQYPIEIPQLSPPIHPSLSLSKVIKNLLRQSYLPTVLDKKIVWLSPGSSRVVEDLSQRIFFLSSNVPPSSSFVEDPKPYSKVKVNNKEEFNFNGPVNIGRDFNVHAENIEINKLTIHASCFSPSLTDGIFNLPKPPPNFVGRKEVLEELHALCQSKQRVILSGLGGVGKTATALQYAEEHKQDYSFIHFILGATFDLITEGLLHLADHQKIPAGKPQERLELLKAHLNRFQKPFLLIFDGVDSPESFEQLTPFLPNQGHSLLVTSRLANEGEEEGFTRLELLPFTEEEAVAYLFRATGDPDKTQAALLAKELGYLPLALKHAAAYIKKNTQTSTLQDYLLLFQKHGVKLHDRKYLRLTVEKKTILTTWEISFTAIAQECEPSIKLAHFLSCLAHAPIPKVVIQTWFQTFLNCSDLEFARALGYLADYSLLEMAKDRCNVHTLVQQVIHFSLSELQYKEYLQEALKSLVAYIHLDAQIPEKRAFLVSFVPHFEEVLDRLKKEPLSRENKEHLLNLARCLWDFTYYGGKYLKAWETSQIQLEIALAEYGEKSIAAGASYNNFGLSLHILGKYQEALKYLRKALEIRQKLLGVKHSDVASSLDSVGATYGALGKYKKSLKYKRKALKIRQGLLGPKHPDLASSLDNVGFSYGALGQYKEALKYQREALEMARELLGNKHPSIASSLNNVGFTYGELGEYKEALKHLKEAIDMWRELLGPKHPHIASTLNNMGTVYGNLGKHEKAMKYKKEALEMRQKLLGPKHPSIAASLNNVGLTYGRLGKHKRALKYQKEALKMRQELLGLKHPDVLASLNAVELSYKALGKQEKALHYQTQTFKMQQEMTQGESLHS